MRESLIESDDIRWSAIMDSIIQWNIAGRTAHIYSAYISSEVASEIRDLWEFSNGVVSVN